MKIHKIYIVAIPLVFILFSCSNGKYSLETTYLKIGIDKKGNISSFIDINSSVNYSPKKQRAPLLSLYSDSAYTEPISADFNQTDEEIRLHYPNGSEALISVKNKGEYLRFELLSLEPRNGTEAVVWGPYPTTIDKLIGETICVVRNDDFAVGLQGLNIITIEGIPDDGDKPGHISIIDPLPGQKLPDSLKNKIGMPIKINVNRQGDIPEYVRTYRGSAAVKKSYGSQLRMFARDRRIPRVLGTGSNIQFVQPIDVDFVGTAIAMFGCPERATLDVIEKIELGENLPHPTLDGVWIKRSPRLGEVYISYKDNPKNIVKYAKACDVKLVHIGRVFQTWGHFGLKTKRFPNGAPEIRKIVENSRKEGISLGIQTLTMFTETNDPYVSPVPSDSLYKTGSSILSRDVTENDSIIYIEDPLYFRNLGITHTAKIDKELINYRAVSDDPPWRLLDCIRGVYGTAKSSHETETAIDKLTNNVYRGFLPDIHLQDEYAKRLAQVCNETGVDFMGFDGNGSYTGHGSYGAGKFIDLWYKNLDRYRINCGASAFHYYWHIYSFMNWGEAHRDDLRKAQVNYRIENQRYFERNLMPGMLGWFILRSTDRPEDVEWIQARSAGFNAGYLLRVSEGIEKSGFKEQLFEAIREWQKARKQDAFSPEQKERLKDPKNEFHLEKLSENSWNLYPVNLSQTYKHQYRLVQDGEPVLSEFTIDNPYPSQPIQFYVTVNAASDNVVNISYQKSAKLSQINFTVNNYQTLEVNESFNAGDRIYCDGKAIYLCDKTWKKLKVIKPDRIPRWEKGNNEVSVECVFSAGVNSPVLEIDFKSVGLPERIGSGQ